MMGWVERARNGESCGILTTRASEFAEGLAVVETRRGVFNRFAMVGFVDLRTSNGELMDDVGLYLEGIQMLM